MANSFEVIGDLASVRSMDDQTLIAEYDELFEEVDFEALGIKPGFPTEAKPGSEDKVVMLAARYSAGLPLWHDGDCYDHGPIKLAESLDD